MKNTPKILYGTAWKKERTTELIELALNAGFRGIDTANQPKHYSEKLVGDALRNSSAKISRDEIFLQTKFTPVDGHDERIPYDPNAPISEQVKTSFLSSLKNLQTDYVNSYLLHGPYNFPGLGAEDFEAWSAIENIFEAGGAKMIGISNVNFEQLKELTSRARIRPMVVQNRCYASRVWDKAVRDFCRENQIIYQGFSLLTANTPVLRDPRILSIAQEKFATPEQIVFGFAISAGMLPLTGTTRMEHMKIDLAALEISLSDAQMRSIESIAN